MQRIEKIIALVLVYSAILVISFSYYSKAFSKPDPLKEEDALHLNLVKEQIEKRFIININTADHYTLTSLTGIGPTLAERIIDYRRENGYFNDPSEITNIKGIGPKKYEAIKDNIRIDV